MYLFPLTCCLIFGVELAKRNLLSLRADEYPINAWQHKGERSFGGNGVTGRADAAVLQVDLKEEISKH
jgi:hypothetical protein